MMTTAPTGTLLRLPKGYEPKNPARPLPWSHAEHRLDAATVYWLATTRPGGAPHVAPIWAIWGGGALYFDGYDTATWARNLATNPAASIHLESGTDVLIVDGEVTVVPAIEDEALAAHIVERWTKKYKTLVPDPARDRLWRLRVRRARGWTAFPDDVTTWRFD
jgi:nitroimidazol reductase NimA-like FMN-containing flavoprotein (pyridoxamine 5'-phosphate oxidase superfamily)